MLQLGQECDFNEKKGHEFFTIFFTNSLGFFTGAQKPFYHCVPCQASSRLCFMAALLQEASGPWSRQGRKLFRTSKLVGILRAGSAIPIFSATIQKDLLFGPEQSHFRGQNRRQHLTNSSLHYAIRISFIFIISGLLCHPNQQSLDFKESQNLHFNLGSVPGLKLRLGDSLQYRDFLFR